MIAPRTAESGLSLKNKAYPTKKPSPARSRKGPQIPPTGVIRPRKNREQTANGVGNGVIRPDFSGFNGKQRVLKGDRFFISLTDFHVQHVRLQLCLFRMIATGGTASFSSSAVFLIFGQPVAVIFKDRRLIYFTGIGRFRKRISLGIRMREARLSPEYVRLMAELREPSYRGFRHPLLYTGTPESSFGTVVRMQAPCSVKAQVPYLTHPHSELDVTICDFRPPRFTSSRPAWSGRLLLRRYPVPRPCGTMPRPLFCPGGPHRRCCSRRRD